MRATAHSESCALRSAAIGAISMGDKFIVPLYLLSPAELRQNSAFS
jgi:hypothetical protein